MKYHSSGATRQALTNIGLVLFSIFLSLAIIEIAFRLMAYYNDVKTLWAFQRLNGTTNIYGPTDPTSLRRIIRPSKNPRIVYELIPNLSLTFLDKPYMTNPHGYRGPVYSNTKDENVFRLVGLGDSIMWGWGVADNEYYLALLDVYLNNSAPDGYSWEIINTAVPGYNTAMEVETFKEKGVHYKPDIVIIGFFVNDLSLPNFIRKAENYFDLRRSFAVEYFSSRLMPYHENFSGGLMDAPPPDIGQHSESDPLRVPTEYKDMVGFNAYQLSMIKMKELSLEYNFQIVVFTHWRIPDVLKDVLKNLNIPILEAFPSLETYMITHGIKEYMGSPLTVSKHDGHPSALAHTILADVLYNYLQEEDILGQIYKRRGFINVSK